MKSGAIIKALKREGFTLMRIRGSHHVFRKGDRVAVVPHPKKDISIGTFRSIERQSGVKLR